VTPCILVGTYKIFCFEDGSSTVISGFRRDVDETCVLLGYYAASNGNPLLTFRDNVSVPFFVGVLDP
jgi:hypothetical protein